ncbi:cytochrome c biogenesis CcdA family protein [Rhizobium sp. PL01]|uniref:cytochrome c biogenesis CcdA family protein n=1 Tax=Rhizobium sp. PL01 TaxID=3085631 RepID=UPI00298169D0|nr:cytochrome c biogenesis protein CcdA [Rhizobium sp. PL01]MDW5318513.1 cytochrome c biogenesis protein CcdA [Rhizobium sp. PL01]
MFVTAFFALLAGIFSTLSPCVLPLLPVVLGAATSRHRFGVLALAGGLTLSFVSIGLFVALIGFSIGLDLTVFRTVGGMVMIGLGCVLMLPAVQMRLATAASPIATWTEERFGGVEGGGLSGQLLVGLLLGAVWSPCVGPTLGAASIMAARGENLGQVILTMLTFGIGASLPLLALGALSRETIIHWRGRMLTAGKGGKMLLGAVLLTVGILIVTGLDKQLEAMLVAASPVWLTQLTTSF